MFKNIPGFPTDVRVNEYGIVLIGKLDFEPKTRMKGDYLSVAIYGKEYRVHRLVALAFLGEPLPEQTDVDHIDSNKLNNHYTNLEWVTRSENIKRSFAAGTHKPSNPKAVVRIDPKGSMPVISYTSITEAAVQNNTYTSSIIAVLKGRRKTSGGFIWKEA